MESTLLCPWLRSNLGCLFLPSFVAVNLLVPPSLVTDAFNVNCQIKRIMLHVEILNSSLGFTDVLFFSVTEVVKELSSFLLLVMQFEGGSGHGKNCS